MSGRSPFIEEQLAQAKSAEKSGNLGDAAKIYQAIVQRQPNNKLAKKRLNAILKSANSTSPASGEFKHLVTLYNSGRLSELITLGNALARKFPGFAPLQNLLGVANAGMGDLEKALIHYSNALSVKPDYAEVHNNRGNALNRCGRHEEAVASFREALESQPNYAEAHNNLGNALHNSGKLKEAAESYSKALRLNPEYAEAHNNLGNAFVDLGKLDDALACFTLALKFNPRFAPAYNNIGNALRAAGRLDESVQNYAAAIRINPNYPHAYLGLGNTLNDQGLHREAAENIRKTIDLNPDSAVAHCDLGNVLSEMGRFEEAVASYQAALSLNPDFAEAYCNLGNVFCDSGKFDQGIDCYFSAIRLKRDFAEAHNNISLIKKYDSEDEHFEAMQQRIADPTISENERMWLSFALGKANEDLGNIDESFKCLQQGNQIRKKESGYDIRVDSAEFDRIKSLFEDYSAPVKPCDGWAESFSKSPIFIVGMPRSGTSLVEQILASHSQVFGAGELKVASRILTPLFRDLTSGVSQGVSDAVLSKFKAEYRNALVEFGKTEAFVTDKMPGNFKWLGFILAAMPGVKVINLQRDPAATCWSIFKRQFTGHGYSNDLCDVAEYYLLYQDLMNFWHQRFPGTLYDLSYETLTENQEQETRQLLEYCGLPWEEQCLDFQNSERAVRTFSGQQVRKKMYTGSSEAWRKYEKHLQPMLAVLNAKDNN